MKFKQAKCIFSIPTWKFFGFVISPRDIKASFIQIKVLLVMPYPQSI